MDQFKGKFLDEAHSLLHKIENSLIDFESNSVNDENIHEVFRAMHTLKGTSVMFGYEHIGEITHITESVFDKIREGEIPLSKEIMEFSLISVDHIRRLLKDEKMSEIENQINHYRLMSDIRTILDIKNIVPAKSEKKNEQHSSIQTYYISFSPDEKMLERGISILSIFSELSALGEYRIIKVPQSKSTDMEDIWGIFLYSDKEVKDVLDVFIFVEENVKIVKLSDSDIRLYDFSWEKSVESTDFIDKSIENILKDDIEKKSIEKRKDVTTISPDNTGLQKTQDIKITQNTGINSRILVDSSRLDVLMYLVSELVTTKARLRLVESSGDFSQFSSIVEKVEGISMQFRDNVLKIRLVPVSEMLIPFKRLIRDLSKKLDKKINFISEGVDTELDKNIIDRLSDPLMHILRNSIDHGIEIPEERLKKGKSPEGIIKFTSFYSGSNVIITIEDDGAGLDCNVIRAKAIQKGLIKDDADLSEKELFELIFHPGFSTAKEVTDISGRGVGMDVVKRAISEVRGEVFIESKQNSGTKTTIILRQTISITDSLLTKVQETFFLIPISEIEYCDQKNKKELYKSRNRRVELNGCLIPFISIRDEFSIGGEHPEREKLVIVHQGDNKIALVVDEIIGEHQAVLKPLGEVFVNQEYISGASVLGDGNLALMLDSNLLINYAYKSSL